MAIDSRAYSEDKIIPPSPLPHVSRSALKRVKDAMPPPNECNYCDGDVSLVGNHEIYGRNYGDWPYAYLCSDCGAYVGLHPHTDLPLGTLADKETREARKDGKASFIVLMRKRKMKRDNAYKWLAKRLRISQDKCHWAMFDVSTALNAKSACLSELRK